MTPLQALRMSECFLAYILHSNLMLLDLYKLNFNRVKTHRNCVVFIVTLRLKSVQKYKTKQKMFKSIRLKVKKWGSKYFESTNSLVRKDLLGPKKCWIQKISWYKKFVGQIIFHPNFFLVQ